MTPQERDVIEAARAFFDAWDTGQSTLSRISNLGVSLRALSAIPPATEPEPVGDVVEVRAHVRLNTMDRSLYIIEGGGNVDGSDAWPQRAGTFATIRARVPLPSIPEVVGEVEG